MTLKAWRSGDKLNLFNINDKTAKIAIAANMQALGNLSTNGFLVPIKIVNETGAILVRGEVAETKDGYTTTDGEHIDPIATAIDVDTVDGRVVVCLQTIGEDEVGFAVSIGYAMCFVNVTDALHEFCLWKDGEAEMESQAEDSRFRIIKADGTGASTVCLVLITGSGESGSLDTPDIITETFIPEAPNADEWDIATSQGPGNLGVEVDLQTRTVYNPGGDMTIYGFTRKFTFNSSGRLLSIGPEVRSTVTAPVLCTPPP